MIIEDDIRKAKILVVDDQEVSIRLITEILSKAGYTNIITTTNPLEVKSLYLALNPDLLILDLYMPDLDGIQVMNQLRGLSDDSYLPIIVISTEENQEVRFLALQSGAKDFLQKPYDRVEALIRIRNLIEVRMLHNEVVNQNRLLEDKVLERTQELNDTQLDVIQRLARAVEYRDSETGMHIIRMSHYAACLASKIGLTMQECEMILKASPLHDIGKIAIPDSILRKKGFLTPEEWEIMKTHTLIGEKLLSGSASALLNLAKEIALTHHEKWDGTGYPHGLKGERIPLVGRICCISDVFDALTTERPYKQAWTFEKSMEEIEKRSGTHFDPFLIKCFKEISSQILHIKEKYGEDPTHKNQ
jgi:putative two-component system response regulator